MTPIKADQSREFNELQERVKRLEAENERLRSMIPSNSSDEAGKILSESAEQEPGLYTSALSSKEIERYSRQLLVRGGMGGVEGQLKLLKSRVLVVGAGGIGSTVILYLAACGVGHLSIVDFDEVDTSNLHRQVIHKSSDVGMNKAESACKAVKDLNPTICCEAVKMPLTASNGLQLVSGATCVVDASDNPLTRYLINDACVLGGKPLVSGSAMGTEGQLTVYNFNGGPCYRCLYPGPNASEGSKSCADNGVLGPVPGLIGILQASEVIKIITDTGDVMYDRLLMYDSLQCSFLRIKKPPKQPKCPICGPEATIKSMENSENVSRAARGPSCNFYSPPSILDSLQVSCKEYKEIREEGKPHVLLDVRVREQFELCCLEGAVNVPLGSLEDQLRLVEDLSDGTKTVYCVCRRGIASVKATNILIEAALKHPRIHSTKNVKGGLNSWREEVDGSFPKY